MDFLETTHDQNPKGSDVDTSNEKKNQLASQIKNRPGSREQQHERGSTQALLSLGQEGAVRHCGSQEVDLLPFFGLSVVASNQFKRAAN